MALKEELLDWLDSLEGRSSTLAEMAAEPQKTDIVGLRHDIDHDIDLALELAAAEHERGLRATYFLLHTAPYWDDERLELKVRQLHEYGHEVGLHVNVLSEWMEGEIDDIAQRLDSLLGRLRSAGIPVVGTSAHGDRRCYEGGYINNWIWSELRGSEPERSEAGRSPEGVAAPTTEREIRYPPSELLERDDGGRLQLWLLSQREFGISYEAARIPTDHYWSDTGGRWQFGDPFVADLRSGRHQILIHPWWWRRTPRAVFCLGAVRSGQAWLTESVAAASSAAVVEDWTLHHDRSENSFFPRQGSELPYSDPQEAARLIRVGLAHRRLTKRDAIEVSSILTPVARLLRTQHPEGPLVHLHRDGEAVVKELVRHGISSTTWPPVSKEPAASDRPEGMSELERACWYWRWTTQELEELADHSISVQLAVEDPGYLAARLGELGISLHPLLAAEAAADVVAPKPPGVLWRLVRWRRSEREVFEDICGETQRRLGYG